MLLSKVVALKEDPLTSRVFGFAPFGNKNDPSWEPVLCLATLDPLK